MRAVRFSSDNISKTWSSSAPSIDDLRRAGSRHVSAAFLSEKSRYADSPDAHVKLIPIPTTPYRRWRYLDQEHPPQEVE